MYVKEKTHILIWQNKLEIHIVIIMMINFYIIIRKEKKKKNEVANINWLYKFIVSLSLKESLFKFVYRFDLIFFRKIITFRFILY